MINEIKVNGKLTRFTNDEINERFQKDVVADIVCAPCEDRFTVDDTWAPSFFRDKKYFKGTTSFQGKVDMEIHDAT